MARKPRDFDAELQALMERARKLKNQKTVQLGELVQVTGADALPVEALAGALLAAVEQSKKQPEAVARWTERGAAFFRGDAKRGKGAKGAGAGEPASGAGSAGPGTPAAGGGA
ncbi:conjugal transfer protein TraC [Pseudoroseomonas rhizosphaerae]|uniref:Conjugal transfer protein TraC n=1 Tax=Teichococcus rhizosphaerae TaxID=1335062 RepID=A0A2C7A9W3_9PROT|nr:conjugal transfer protein TraD [Pseudoroseomonas rhizosphaerae]PHK93417.1 conjugal transfer protein TraC [Pseudoroseomonas rhizosphaerae]